MNDVLTATDGALEIVEEGASWRRYALAIDVTGAVAERDATKLAPARNALYAKALRAVVSNEALQALVADVREDGDEQTLEVEIEERSAIDGGGNPTAYIGLHLVAEYEERDGEAKRESVLAAVKTALDGNAGSSDLCVRERVVLALVALLDAEFPGRVLREPDRPVPLDAIVIREGGHRAESRCSCCTTYTMAVRIKGVAVDAQTAGDYAAQAIDLIRAADRLDGIAVDVAEGPTEPEFERSSYVGDTVCIGVTALVTFATEVDDPYAEAA